MPCGVRKAQPHQNHTSTFQRTAEALLYTSIHGHTVQTDKVEVMTSCIGPSHFNLFTGWPYRQVEDQGFGLEPALI